MKGIEGSSSRPIAAILGCCALLALVAAPAQGASTRAEYATQVNAICVGYAAQVKAMEKRIGRKLKKAPKAAGARQIGRLMRRSNALFNAQVIEINAVTAAPGDEALVASWIDSLWRMARVNKRAAGVVTRSLKALARLDRKPSGDDPDKLGKDLARVFGELGRILKVIDAAIRANNYSATFAEQLGTTACVKPIETDPGGFSRDLRALP